MAPVVATLVLEGGRVGEELGGIAMLELASALAAVTAESCHPDDLAAPTSTDGAAGDTTQTSEDGSAPSWIDDTLSRAASSGGSTSTPSRHIDTVVPGVLFPSLDLLRAAVRRCALTRVALVPVAIGSPKQVAEVLGTERAAQCAAQVLAPGRKGVSRQVQENVGAALWDAGVGREIAASNSWLENLLETSTTDTPNALPSIPPHYYVYPEGILGEAVAWGIEAKTVLRAIDAPNAMPPEQALLAVNCARVKFGSTVIDPCVGGGAVAFAAMKLGAGTVVGSDVDEDSLEAAHTAAVRYFGINTEINGGWERKVDETTDDSPCTEKFHDKVIFQEKDDASNSKSKTCTFAKASLLDDPSDVSSIYYNTKNQVDAIVTDLPYGVRSAVMGIGDGVSETSPGDVLDALLRLADFSLKPNGRIVVWLRRVVGVDVENSETEKTYSNDTNPETEKSRGMPVEEVTLRAERFGFAVERCAAENRKTGVQRALYMLVRNKDKGVERYVERYVNKDLDKQELSSINVPYPRFGEAEDTAKRNAVIAHCLLRRNENHGRVVETGGCDVWRSAWVGDLVSVRKFLELFGAKVAFVREPVCNTRGSTHGNTPLLCASGFGRKQVVDALLEGSRDTDVETLGFKVLGFRDEMHLENETGKTRRYTSTHRAAERGHVEILRTLLSRGDDPFRVRPETVGGGTALHSAAERGHCEAFEVLVQFCLELDFGIGKNEEKRPVLLSSLLARDDSGRTPALAAARRGHASVVTAALQALATNDIRVQVAEASKSAVEAARWGHVGALKASLSFLRVESVQSFEKSKTGAALFSEAKRWKRDTVLRFLEDEYFRDIQGALARYACTVRCEPLRHDSRTPPKIDSAEVIKFFPKSGASLLYAKDFFCGTETINEMLTQFEPDYLPRDDPLVTPADRRGEKREVPRDQAYYAVQYEGIDVTDAKNQNENQKRTWFASYRYNPDKTQQPRPSFNVPPGLLKLSGRIAQASGQVCNHVVVNRYRDLSDSIGAHADKDLDLAGGSFVVSVSFGAERTMTFAPRRFIEDGDDLTQESGSNNGILNYNTNSIGPDVVKAKRRALFQALNRDPEWFEVNRAKSLAPAKSDAKKIAVERERSRTSFLRATDEVVIAAALEADIARNDWRDYKKHTSIHLPLKHGSAVFFNMAFNENWTHAIDAVGDDLNFSESDKEDEDEDESDERKDEKGDKNGNTSTTPLDGSNSSNSETTERVGVTLRRCHTVFDPDLCFAPDVSRAKRKDTWRSVSDMADVHEAERKWRGEG